MGRRALPANVHQLRGNPSKLPAGELAGQSFVDAEIPACPKHLKDEARKEWRRISKHLLEVKLVTQLDRAALAAYCVNWARWVYAESKLAELGDYGLVESTPSGYKQMGVWLQVANRSQEQMHRFMREFGLTPSARASLNIAAAQGSLFPDADPMSSLLAAGAAGAA